MRNFDRVRVDLRSETITVGSAVTMLGIRDALRPYGLQTEVTPEIGNATAGSLACCGTKDASVGRQGLAQVASTVVGVRFVNARGQVEAISADADPARLHELRSSYGLLGVVFEVTFRTQPSAMLEYDYRVFRLDPLPSPKDLLGGADGLLGFMLPYLKRIIVERRRIANDGSGVSRFSRLKRRTRDTIWESASSFFPSLVPHNPAYYAMDVGLMASFRGLSLLGGFRAARSDSTIDFKAHRRHHVDFTFWAIPVSRWGDFVPAYLGFCEDFKASTGFRASLVSEVYLMNQDRHSLLSPSHREAVFTADAVDHRMSHPLWADFNRRLNSLAADFGGRPLLNQTKELSREVVHRTLNDDWKRFLASREAQDPDGRFLSDYFRELM